MMQITRRLGRAGGDSGAQAVEFALILPVLLMLVLGIINFGYLFGQKLALNQAVREGARMAVVAGSDRSGYATEYAFISAKVQGALGGVVPAADPIKVNEAGASLGTTEGCEVLEVGEQLQVTAQYVARPLVPTFVPGLNGPFTLTSKAVFRCEWQG